MWKDLSPYWQEAFLQAWESFQKGSIPIGAVMVDTEGTIIGRGRNKTAEKGLGNPRIAHAEMDLIRSLDVEAYPNIRQYTLYTTMEPCPMCMGTIVMANVRKVRIAARDSYCGAVHYCQYDPYIRAKQMDIVFEAGEIPMVHLTLQSYFEYCAIGGAGNRVLDAFAKTSPVSVALAKELYEERFLHRCAEEARPFEVVWDEIVRRAASL